jgi:hypothetical protein
MANNMRKRVQLAREIEKTSEAIRKKHRALKTGMIEEDIAMERRFKPIVEPLKQIVEESQPIKREAKDIKTEEVLKNIKIKQRNSDDDNDGGDDDDDDNDGGGGDDNDDDDDSYKWLTETSGRKKETFETIERHVGFAYAPFYNDRIADRTVGGNTESNSGKIEKEAKFR